MKIVLFGSNGMLGEYLKSYLSKKYDVLSLTRKDIDLSVIDESSLMNFLKNNVSKDDIIINGCGIIKQRDYKPIEMIMVNSVFPNLLAKFKKDIDCKIIHITTDCVFSGSRGLYVETDKHDCLDDYGKSKSLGENPLLTTIRTSIIGEEKSNKKSLLEWVISNRNKTIDGYDNHLWNGVTCLELSKFISEMIENNNFWEGVKHIFSPSTLSKYELVNIINDVYDLNITVNKKTTDVNCYRNLSSNSSGIITKTLKEQILELKEYIY